METPHPPEDLCLLCRDLVTIPHDKLDKTLRRRGNLIRDFQKLCNFLKINFSHSLKKLTPILSKNNGDCWKSFLCPQCLGLVMALSDYYNDIHRIQKTIDFIIRDFQKMIRKADRDAGLKSGSGEPPRRRLSKKRRRVAAVTRPVNEMDYPEFAETFRRLLKQVITEKPIPVVLSNEADSLRKLYEQAEEESDKYEQLRHRNGMVDTDMLKESEDLQVVYCSAETDDLEDGTADMSERGGSNVEATTTAEVESQIGDVLEVMNDALAVNEMECESNDGLGIVIVGTSGSEVVKDISSSRISQNNLEASSLQFALKGAIASHQQQRNNVDKIKTHPPVSPPCILLDSDNDDDNNDGSKVDKKGDDDIIIIQEVNHCDSSITQKIKSQAAAPNEKQRVYVYNVQFKKSKNSNGALEAEGSSYAVSGEDDPFKITYFCRFCHAYFGTAAAYYSHRKGHHPMQSVALNIPCAKQQNGDQNLTKASQLFRICPICSDHIRGKRSAVHQLMEHMLSHDSTPNSIITPNGVTIVPAERVPYTCNHCQQQFRLEINLELHQICYHESTLVNRICDKCGACFKTTPLLISHLREEHDVKTIQSCKSCPMAFSSELGLLKHMLVHSESKRLICPECEQVFADTKELYRHFHNSHMLFLTPVHCDTCLRVFLNKQEVQIHENHAHRSKRTPYEKVNGPAMCH